MALAENKKAYFDYEILEKLEAGIKLLGFEVKSIMQHKASLLGARIIIRGNEAYIVGMNVPPYQEGNTPKGYESDRTRKLLLHKKEIKYLAGKQKERGLTLVPLKLYNNKHKTKLGFALVRGKKKHDKRDIIRKRETARKISRSLKNY